jgi:V/A-type H+-transporting ATPase subunit A
MDRTVIICNTSSMPVAAREASIYTGITISEYYRQMGYNVLVIADSTSRWAQAMRETSGRLEEIPGEEAFPAYLDSAVRALYERAGMVQTNDGSTGSLTLIGTVSPAGGNFEEPVTQSTLRTVKTFLGLSAERAYKRAYPAVDPLISWSRYLDQLEDWFTRELSDGWVGQVKRMIELIRDGEQVQQMMQVTGEEGVTLDDYLTFQKAQCLDQVYLQQDAFDDVDASTSLSRQQELFGLLVRCLDHPLKLEEKEQVREHFVRLSGLFRNLNYSRQDSPDYTRFLQEIEMVGLSAAG